VKYIGNFAEFIKDEWITEVLSGRGKARPKDWPPAYTQESNEYKKARDAGYDLEGIHWYVFDSGEDLSFQIEFPFLKNENHWWITKLYPGQYMPMHSDPHVYEQDGTRYWIPLQDYHPGHVFIYNDTLMTDYKKGDVFVFYDSYDIHGAANIGHIPRLSLLITEYV